MIEMLIGALILLIGIVIGRLSTRLRSKAVTTVEPEAICGCQHHHSYHDESGCGYFYYSSGRKVTCGCKKYSGPEPLPKYIAGEL